jgi:hypothetical protein
MKSAKEKAEEYSLTRNYRREVQFQLDAEAFSHGAMSTNEFISIKDEMPEDNPSLLSDDGKRILKGQKIGLSKTKEVIVQFTDGDHEVGRRFKCAGDDYFWWGNIESFDEGSKRFITHWKPLEYPLS